MALGKLNSGPDQPPRTGSRMKTLIVYASRTGNTRMIAEAVHAVMPPGTALVPVEEAPAPSGYDFIALGFWVDRGAPNASMLAYMDRVRNTAVGLFGTLGAWPDSEHARGVLQKAEEHLAGNRILGTFLCQGRVDPALLASMAKKAEKQGNSPHPMTEERKARLEEAARHPDAEDCAAARRVFTGILRRLKTADA